MRTFLLLSFICCFIELISGHGRLLDPPMRASVWRFEEFEQYDPPVNYDDDAFWCGGMQTQHTENGGKCGLCGDNYKDNIPRSMEDFGTYGRGVLVRNYTAGQIVPIKVELTGAHKGHFEFHLCSRQDRNTRETEECFEKHILQLGSPDKGHKFPVGTKLGVYNTKVKLPQGVKCSRCVLRWHYRTGNTWGDCGNGTSEVGCGPQETFRGCADVSIL